MSFLVFLLVLSFGTIFALVSIQARRMALEGLSPWSAVPVFLARKLSSNAYAGLCVAQGCILAIVAGMIYNADAKDPGGPFWASIYLAVLALGYFALWLRNRSVDLRP